MISEMRAKMIAENPDACHIDDLADLMEFVAVEDNNTSVDPSVSLYCCYSFIARTLRTQGKINKARAVEKMMDSLYQVIPKEVRW